MDSPQLSLLREETDEEVVDADADNIDSSESVTEREESERTLDDIIDRYSN